MLEVSEQEFLVWKDHFEDRDIDLVIKDHNMHEITACEHEHVEEYLRQV